ncbi:MAG TPA: imidazole glycerol phosphate synthase subunit HisH [Puia sp.]|jgi:glutamine amidotransferase|nr:imidazole glycerol phosphate synthase subunit HisH [Puia sp.]
MNLAIVKYNAGNIQSVLYALERIGREAVVTDDAAVLRAADKVIFPGVGEASTAMNYLKERGLDELIKGLQQPVLGICLGMQLMCSYSEENDTECLGIFETRVKKFAPAPGGDFARGSGELKVPQIGWNNVFDLKTGLFEGVADRSYCYFVHGYYAALSDRTIGRTDYGLVYSSALHRGNFYGVQFHPEKSAQVGERILKNFIDTI